MDKMFFSNLLTGGYLISGPDDVIKSVYASVTSDSLSHTAKGENGGKKSRDLFHGTELRLR